jgi:Na+/H+ antiporter NhaD/arsenite permease-like protein
MVIMNIARETDFFEGLAIWMVGRKADYPILF